MSLMKNINGMTGFNLFPITVAAIILARNVRKIEIHCKAIEMWR